MAKRTGARLAEGTTITDYSNPTRILRTFNNDMRAIRAEYSRQRSIIRKRLDRLEKAGEVYNKFYQYYGKDRNVQIPSLKGLSDSDVLDMLSRTAGGIGRGFQSTVKEVREARKEVFAQLELEAEESGDTAFAQQMKEGLTASQYSKVGYIMRMINKVVGRLNSSDEAYQKAMKYVVNSSDPKESLLSKAGRIIKEMGLDPDDTIVKLEDLKNTFKNNGQYRANYLKSRGKRG